MTNIYIEDGSGDKKYFTMLPNVLIDKCPAIVLALYCQIKRACGEKSDGLCYLSQNTLQKKLDITRGTLKKYIKILLTEDLISYVGDKQIITKGGLQNVKTYRIVDIWKKNIEHFEGGSKKNTPKGKGGSKFDTKGGQNSTPKKNLREEDKIVLSEQEIKERKEKIIAWKKNFGVKDFAAIKAVWKRL